jgi:selenide,water dikinase
VRRLTPPSDPDLLVGAASGDDAAVYRLSDERALVVTADFITPVVDDARQWGQVAAANAVSDVYAMGGRPLLALNLVCWNTEELSNDLLGDVLAGGQDVADACGFVIAGGHTVDDPEPKYGLAVVGEVHPDRILTNAGLRPQQALVLTKALGVGILTTAQKRDVAQVEWMDAAIASMVRTNRRASEVAVAAGATGATDVTGFGLLGHGSRMAQESQVDLVINVDAVPLLDGTRELAADGVVPGGSGRNRAWAEPLLDVADGVADLDVTILADAQTSGGLLFGIDPDRAESVIADLRRDGHQAAVIGNTTTGSGRISLIRT